MDGIAVSVMTATFPDLFYVPPLCQKLENVIGNGNDSPAL